ncbi:MAG TPA: flagellar basal body protein [Ramlibacter sp.]|nr:flagellar basal body protein [Ramlibacter sp.]
MTDGLEAVTTATLGLALDAASLRQQAIAANIANHATPGYVPLRVNFEAQLEDARRTLKQSGKVDEASLAGVKAQLEPVLDAHGAPAKVHLDAQIADMAQNAVHYQALSRALNRQFAILALATADGKR